MSALYQGTFVWGTAVCSDRDTVCVGELVAEGGVASEGLGSGFWELETGGEWEGGFMLFVGYDGRDSLGRS